MAAPTSLGEVSHPDRARILPRRGNRSLCVSTHTAASMPEMERKTSPARRRRPVPMRRNRLTGPPWSSLPPPPGSSGRDRRGRARRVPRDRAPAAMPTSANSP